MGTRTLRGNPHGPFLQHPALVKIGRVFVARFGPKNGKKAIKFSHRFDLTDPERRRRPCGSAARISPTSMGDISQVTPDASNRSFCVRTTRENASKNWYTSRFVRVILLQGPC